MSAQRAELRISEPGIGAFDVAAVAESHELRRRIDARRRPDRGNPVTEVIKLPGQMHLVSPVRLLTRNNQGAAAWGSVQARHNLRPQDCAVLIVQWDLDELAGFGVEDAHFRWRVGRAIVSPR